MKAQTTIYKLMTVAALVAAFFAIGLFFYQPQAPFRPGAINYAGVFCNSGETYCVDSYGMNIRVNTTAGTQKFLVDSATGNTTVAGTLDFANSGNLRPSSGVTNTFGNFYLINTVARTDTSNKAIGVLPANVQIADVTIYFSTASNAGTTATVSCGKTSATPTEYINAADVKAGATLQRGGASATMPVTNYGGVGASAVIVYCKYAETGTASTTGGPFTVIIDYAN